MMEAMQAELQRLKAAAAVTTPVLPAPVPPVAASVGTAPTAVAGKKLSLNVYGFVQSDSIYDFKRVDPNWEDTLRATTIPVQSGTFGNDGDFGHAQVAGIVRKLGYERFDTGSDDYEVGWGINAYYDHYWNGQWSTSVGWSMTDLDITDGLGPDEFKQGRIAQINLLH